MGYKYEVRGFNHPYLRHKGYDKYKGTKFLIIAIFWFIVFAVRFDSVDMEKRK